jgi:hypothetical protein
MNCRKCGREDPTDAAFCGECGASLAGETQCAGYDRSTRGGCTAAGAASSLDTSSAASA